MRTQPPAPAGQHTSTSIQVSVPVHHYLAWAVATAAAGIGLGLVAPTVIGWVNTLLDSTPFGIPGPLELIGRLTPGWSLAVFATLGVVGGVALVLAMAAGALSVEISDDDVLLDGAKSPLRLSRGDIASAHLDRGHLELLGTDGRRLARRNADGLPRPKLREAFGFLRIPFHDSDPYRSEFRRWVDGDPELDETTHELLRRRARARTDSKSGRVEELFDALQSRGIVVRDTGDEQQFRTAAVAAIEPGTRLQEGGHGQTH